MTSVKSAGRLTKTIWIIIQLFILPMTLYTATYYNGLPYGMMVQSLANDIGFLPYLFLPTGFVHSVATAIAMVPSALAYFLPSGFTAMHYVFGLLGDHAMTYFFMTVFFATTRPPARIWYGSSKIRNVESAA